MIIRVDGGNIHSLAMGHVFRCLKLAAGVKASRNISARFVMRDYPEGVVKVCQHGYDVTLLPTDMDLAEDVAATAELAAGEILISDVRQYGPKETLLLRRASRRYLAFDDHGGRDLQPHVLVNPSVLPRHCGYPRQRDNVRYCLGLDFFVLGQHKASSRTDTPLRAYTVLVTLGGADPDDYATAMLPIVKPLADSLAFTFVLGPAYGNTSGFMQHLQELGLEDSITVLKDVTDLASLMTEYDMVMTAGGDTCLEMAWSGAAGMIAPTISYESETAEYMEQLGVARSLGDVKREQPGQTRKVIQHLADNHKLRVTMSEAGRRLVDGRGEKRIIKALEI